jgi:phosphoglycerate dehydrogenase-like enzyme
VLRDLSRADRAMHAGEQWPRDVTRVGTLSAQTVGFVGLGTVGHGLLPLLAPFHVSALVFDPYAPKDALTAWPWARFSSLDAVLAQSSIISVHASLTSETVNLLDGPRLRRLRDGALLINTASGQIIDEGALATELASGRIRAALDVYAEEPLPATSPLRQLPNVLLTPHLAGAPSRPLLAPVIVGEIERFIAGRPLWHEITREQFSLMTRSG